MRRMTQAGDSDLSGSDETLAVHDHHVQILQFREGKGHCREMVVQKLQRSVGASGTQLQGWKSLGKS